MLHPQCRCSSGIRVAVSHRDCAWYWLRLAFRRMSNHLSQRSCSSCPLVVPQLRPLACETLSCRRVSLVLSCGSFRERSLCRCIGDSSRWQFIRIVLSHRCENIGVKGVTAHRQRDRSARRAHGLQNPTDPEEDCQRDRRRNPEACPRQPAVSLVTTFKRISNLPHPFSPIPITWKSRIARE
jgi:hypothetical protein